MIHHFDNHNLPMRGIKKACGETRALNGHGVVQIIYNQRTGEIRTRWFASKNSWLAIDGEDCFSVCYTDQPLTMQEIADRIHRAVITWRSGYAARKEN